MTKTLGQIKIFDLSPADIVFLLVCLTGTVILGYWLLRTSLGRKALVGSAPRRNNMPFYLPFVPVAFWFGLTLAAKGLMTDNLAVLGEYEQVLADYLIYAGAISVTTVVVLLLANETFVRRLKGFGFDVKTIGKDFTTAIAGLLAVLPVTFAVIWVVVQAGRLAAGEDFRMPTHEGLEIITKHPQLPVKILLIVISIVIGPVFEEILFRGLFQTMIRGVVGSPWRAIMIASVIFVLMHRDLAHWPALFVLSLSMGYAYEKSGSLFRAIFIHSLFNATSVIAVLNQ